MKCPVCTDVNLAMSERQGVEIDYCPNCRGVWLDRNELDKIIERSNVLTESTREKRDFSDEKPYQSSEKEHYDKKEYYDKNKDTHKKKKKGSFLSDMFDVFGD